MGEANFEFSLIKVEGKPLEKLLEVISNGIGTLYRPRAIRKEAEARAFEVEIIERAKSKALAEGKEIEAYTYDRIQERLLYRETQRQKSFDSVIQIAAEQVSQESEVSEDPVNPDWATRFFNIVGDISDADMQMLWGKLLAGEVKKPKSYSLRTLDILKNLTKEEADVFVRIAKLRLFINENLLVVFNPDKGELLRREYNLGLPELLLLKEVGLIVSEKTDKMTFGATQNPNSMIVEFGEKTIYIKRKGPVPNQDFESILFTKVGTELARLVEQNDEKKYIDSFFSVLKHPNIKLYYGEKKIDSQGNISLVDEAKIYI